MVTKCRNHIPTLCAASKRVIPSFALTSFPSICQKDFTHFCLLSLTIVLASSGIGGGTGSPEIFFTERKRGGQTSKHVPHFVHFSWSMTWIRFLPPTIASAGHFLRQRHTGLALLRVNMVRDQLFAGKSRAFLLLDVCLILISKVF